MESVFILFFIVSFCGIAASYAINFSLKHFLPRITYFKENESLIDTLVLLISTLLIASWGVKFKFFPNENYDFRHGTYVTIGQAMAFAFLLLSAPLFTVKKNTLPKWMLLISGFILLFVQMGELIGIGQE